MTADLVKGEGFAVDASVMEAKRQSARRVGLDRRRSCSGLQAEEIQEGEDGRDHDSDGEPAAKPDRKQPKVVSPSDPWSAWTAKANKRLQFGFGLHTQARSGWR